MRQPRVSVIVPTYNRADLLPHAIESVLAQSFQDFELIVVDDGSTDDTQALLAGYDDPRLVYTAQAHTGNLSKVRNDGLRQARGDYLAFLDSDDIWLPTKLKRQVELLEWLPKVGLILCGFEVFDAAGLNHRELYQSPGVRVGSFSMAQLFYTIFQGRMPYYPSTLLFRKSLLETTSLLDERLRLGDHHFMLRLVFYAKAAILHQALVQIRKHDGNMSLVYEVEGLEQMIYALEHFYASGDISRVFYKSALVNIYIGLNQLVLQPRDATALRRNVSGYVRLLPVLARAWARYVSPLFNRTQ